MKSLTILMCIVSVFLSGVTYGQGLIVGEHLRERVLESPHPYPGSASGQPEIVWTDYYDFPDASYIVFEFSKFDLAPGDWVEIRDPYAEQVHVYSGAGFLNKGGDFITKAVMGPEAVIELYSTNPRPDRYGYRIERISRGYSDEEIRRMYGDDRAICGTDDKLDAKCFETTYPGVYEKSRAVARILMDGSSLCTGWLVSCENHMLTNSHCSWDGDFDSQAKLDRMEFQFMYQRPACGSGTATVEYSFMGGTFLENEHYIDYTLFQAPADENPAATYSWLTIDNRLADIDEQIFIVGHPAGKPKEIALESTDPQDQSGICEVYTVTADPCITGATAPEIGFFCDTEGGSSGSPVLSLDTLKVIALHHCAYCPNRAIRIQDVWAHNQAGPNPLPPCSLFNEIGTVNLDKSRYGCADTIEITVSDGSLPGAGTQDVTIWSDTEPSPETITLYESPADSGSFTGSIQTSQQAPVHGDGIVSVSPGDTVTVRYIDADDGQGGVNIPRETASTVDCTPPSISNVTVSAISAYEALISWQTNEPCSGTVVYGHTMPPGTEASADDLTTNHAILLENLESCAYYYFKVLSHDEAGNMAEDDNGGLYFGFTTLEITILLDADMDTNPGWTYENQWAWGVPQGNSGDPSSGYTGSNVVGYNLSGSYANNLPETFCTTQNIDCSAATEVFLSFYHWLGVESSTWDNASVRVSGNGGSTWTTIWTHTGGNVSPSFWSYSEYDISSVAAGSSNVRIRWVMGTTDSSVVYCGWNIDDVMVSFTSECTNPTPTPQLPTPTPDCLHTGDVTQDGFITAGDAQTAFFIVLGTYSPTYDEACAADCNGDGAVTAADSQQIFLQALGTGACVDPL